MRRQIETGQSLALNGVSYAQDERLNEMDYFGLAGFLKENSNLAVPTSQEEFQTHVRDVLGAWSRAEVGDDLVDGGCIGFGHGPQDRCVFEDRAYVGASV